MPKKRERSPTSMVSVGKLIVIPQIAVTAVGRSPRCDVVIIVDHVAVYSATHALSGALSLTKIQRKRSACAVCVLSKFKKVSTTEKILRYSIPL